MRPENKIYIAGHRGMVGSAILRSLNRQGYNNIINRTFGDLDLRDQAAVNDFFEKEKPDFVFLAAAKVGGIQANNIYRADFLYDNLLIEANIIHAAYKNEVGKLLFLGSSCIYPKLAPQPIKEEYLLTGFLEPTNEPYAIAKIAGIKLCEAYRHQYGCNFISVIPCNLYGKGDNYNLNDSHVLPALIHKMHHAKNANSAEVVIWGSGKPRREFLYADELADACVFLMGRYNDGCPVNIGSGKDLSILELAKLIQQIVGFDGTLIFDTEKPDGTERKLLNVEKLHHLGWKHSIGLEEGIKMAYQDFLKNHTDNGQHLQ